ncbi:MAG TPA: glycerophosphodiester phosphodiesterase family protein [Jatrophihabitans sp.]|jgi:glycerophosphoryl diester phosphodiesterase|uniref:glycerophosphodiester phosphodiesterase family protein n=1 Tax=Jatrophihabitans sp. TaxID=1932789 RepID=UPI002EDDD57C
MARPLSRSRGRPALGPNPNPLVIAHRGASDGVAEHTLPAYLAAIDTGVDGLECDVRLTRDGHLVCVHDRTVNRTSNGSGIVSELDLAGLQELDFLSWHDELPSSADELVADSPYLAGVAPDHEMPGSSAVLTLEKLLGVVADAGRPLRLLIETKHPTRYGGLVEQELVRLLRRFGWAGAGNQAARADAGPDGELKADEPVTIMSFAPTALRRIRLLAPSVPLTLLADERRIPPLRRDGTLPAGVHISGPGIRVLRSEPDYVERAHQAGNRVFCWTVDHPEDVELVRRLGVDAIITNRPAAVLAQLRPDEG